MSLFKSQLATTSQSLLQEKNKTNITKRETHIDHLQWRSNFQVVPPVFVDFSNLNRILIVLKQMDTYSLDRDRAFTIQTGLEAPALISGFNFPSLRVKNEVWVQVWAKLPKNKKYYGLPITPSNTNFHGGAKGKVLMKTILL